MNASAKDPNSDARNRVIGELNSVIKDAENLLRNTENQASEGFKSARAKFESTIDSAKNELLDIEESVVEKAKDAVRTTDEYVQGHPWNSVGLGACVGLLVGLLISKR